MLMQTGYFWFHLLKFCLKLKWKVPKFRLWKIYYEASLGREGGDWEGGCISLFYSQFFAQWPISGSVNSWGNPDVVLLLSTHIYPVCKSQFANKNGKQSFVVFRQSSKATSFITTTIITIIIIIIIIYIYMIFLPFLFMTANYSGRVIWHGSWVWR